MNQVGCQRALRELLLNFESVLVHGLTIQETAKEIRQISFSIHSPPRLYYHILIQIADALEFSFSGKAGNVAKPKRSAFYNCVLHVSDVAVPSGIAEEEPYLRSHGNMRQLCDGIMAMIAGATWQSGGTYTAYFEGLPLCIEDPDTDSAYSIVRGESNDRLVTVQNLDQPWWDEAAQDWTSILYSTIKFRLEENLA